MKKKIIQFDESFQKITGCRYKLDSNKYAANHGLLKYMINFKNCFYFSDRC